MDVNNYRLTLSTCTYEVPDASSKKYLALLREYMDILWEGRRTLEYEELSLLGDKIVQSYGSLTDHFQQSKPGYSMTTKPSPNF